MYCSACSLLTVRFPARHNFLIESESIFYKSKAFMIYCKQITRIKGYKKLLILLNLKQNFLGTFLTVEQIYIFGLELFAGVKGQGRTGTETYTRTGRETYTRTGRESYTRTGRESYTRTGRESYTRTCIESYWPIWAF